MKFIQTVKRRIHPDRKPSSRGDGAKGKQELRDNANPKSPHSEVVPGADTATFLGAAELPKLRQVAPADRPELFRKKLQACSMVMNFSTDDNAPEKEEKRQTLLELVEYANMTRNCFTEPLMQDVVHMVGANIFRAVAVRDQEVLGGPADEGVPDEPALEKAWPHLQIVYEFFLRFIVSNDVDPKIAKRYVDQIFVLNLLDLFDSEDPRERDYLKTILHRVYGKFMALRSFIRRAIQHAFSRVIYESEFHNGLGELLEILGSIINGFALPLKEEHQDFLIRVLIPLCKVKTLPLFHQQLFYCLTQYAEKDPRLAQSIIGSMLGFWPISVASKQVLFLNQLEDMLEIIQPTEFRQVQEALFRRIALCITCPHFQVAERTLFLWNNDCFVRFVTDNRVILFPIVIKALYSNSQHHWNRAVHELTANVLKFLMDADPQLFDECTARLRAEVDDDEEKQVERQRRWDMLRDLKRSGEI